MAAVMATTAYQHGPLHGVFDEKWQRPQRAEAPRSAPPGDSLGGTEDTRGSAQANGYLFSMPGVRYSYLTFLGWHTLRRPNGSLKTYSSSHHPHVHTLAVESHLPLKSSQNQN